MTSSKYWNPSRTYQASLRDGTFDNGRNEPKKERIATYVFVVEHDGKLRAAITFRAWMGRASSASVVYGSVWLRPAERNGCWRSGRGTAGGGGYDKLSAAFGDALDSAGVTMDRDIRGAGMDEAGEGAMVAVAKALGYSVADLDSSWIIVTG